MSELLAASGTLGKLNLDGDKRQARTDLFGFMRTLLVLDPAVEPAMHARVLDEREGPAAATAAARNDRAAADAVDAAQCQKLMGHLIIATVGEARTIVTTAMNGREALAALIEFVDGDASTPNGSDAIIADTIKVSWNAFPNGLELSQFAYDILARLAYAAGESATAYSQTPYNAGDPLYQSLIRGLVKAIGPDHAPHTFNAVHSALAVELHKPESTLSYQEAMHAIRAQARSIGRDRPASLSTMTVVQAETNSLGLGDRLSATLQSSSRSEPSSTRRASGRPPWPCRRARRRRPPTVPHQTDARRPAVLPIAPARSDPLRQHGRARAHQAAPRQLAPPPLPRQHRLRVPRHRARPDDRALLQDRAHARGLPHEGLTRRRVPRERRPRLPGLRVRRALSRPDGTIPPLSPDQAWPPTARDTSADARGDLGLPCTTTSPETSPRRTRASSTFRLAGSAATLVRPSR